MHLKTDWMNRDTKRPTQTQLHRRLHYTLTDTASIK